MASTVVASGDLPITVKCAFDGDARRFKITLRDVLVGNLENKLREVLAIPSDVEAVFERYSDSAGSYITLDRSNVSVYKQLYRAAKAKQKLKLRVTTQNLDMIHAAKRPRPATVEDEPEVGEPSQPAAADKQEQPLISLSPPSRPLTDLVEALDRLESTMNLNEATEAMKREQEKITRNLDMLEASVNALSGMNNTGMYGNGCELRQYPVPPGFRTCLARPLNAVRSVPFKAPVSGSGCTYAVCCNICDKTIPGAHYHCSTCDDGDFDLCQECVNRGETCKGSDHWLIKRFVKDGAFINSTTERIAPKPKAPKLHEEAPAPAVSAERIVPVMQNFLYQNMRTCNSCVAELPESDFVHCDACEDFDLCKACFIGDKHGHHPKHAFSAAVKGAVLEPEVSRRLAPGRNCTHSATCDGCDKAIRGVRHKCLDCPDWDYCNNCIVDAAFVHPDHRFVPIYERIEPLERVTSRISSRPYHIGICCDGPLCRGRGSVYIVGERYKCAVCHDTDFCASCEASPANTHNKTHPLIKFKTPVKYVSVTTSGAQGDGKRMPVMGDQPQPSRASTSSRATETIETKEAIVRTNVLTVADVKPSTSAASDPAPATQIPTPQQTVTPDDLIAVYSRDTLTDGTVLPPNHMFEQTWYLRNEGTVPWPAHCAVKFVGGDYMSGLDPNHPAAVFELAGACQSNIHPSPVAPGEEVPFTVLLRTPAREGKAISYWRLTTKDGMKFGHRLWCDINVQAPRSSNQAFKEYQESLVRELKEEPTKEKEIAQEPLSVAAAEEPAVVSSEGSSEKTEQSEMIFPKLEKESPVSSIHRETQPQAEAPPAYEAEYEECIEDVDWAEEESDSGFLTDEEYDVLDASDEEYLEEQQKLLKK